jgi:lysophospholipase L1-like esterase
MKRARTSFYLLAAMVFCCMAFVMQGPKPVVYIVGDSTVQNSDGNGKNLHWGWGSLIRNYVDTSRITIANHAKPGTSTRTFISEGRWNTVLASLKKGDYVFIQFGHNDQSPVNDTSRARGTLKGIGDETEDIVNLKTQQPETVHTYGWYLKKMIAEAKAKGAIPVVFSLVPRDKWKDGKVNGELDYVNWAEAVANSTQTYYVNLNGIITRKWETLGQEAVKAFFTTDHTHTNLQGAEVNAASAIDGIRLLKDCSFNQYLK